MSDQLTLAAETRDRVGKGASRALRRDGRVPAVIYGQNQEPTAIHIEEKALVRALMSGHFMNSVIMIDGTGAQARTLAKDVAFHPVTDRPVHVDFLRIGEHSAVTLSVPVVFTDEADSGYADKGGVLNVVLHEVEVTCDAAEIPDQITVSLAGRNIGDQIHIADIAMPAGASVADASLVIATIVPPTVPTAADDAADAAVAGSDAGTPDADTVPTGA